MKHRALTIALAAPGLWLACETAARAGDFDSRGDYLKDPEAVAFVDFETEPGRYLTEDAQEKCKPPGFVTVSGEDALDGKGFARVHVVRDCAERFLVDLPKEQRSYRVTAWLRHGMAGLSFVVLYEGGSGLARQLAVLGPTGRTTSDGWIEMASNDFSIDGALVKAAYLRVIDFGSEDGAELDSLEVVASGKFEPQKTCAGAFDPVCGAEAVCVHGLCAAGRLAVPALPAEPVRNDVVDVLAARIRTYFGGARSRKERMPEALAFIESMRKAKNGWQFWGALNRAVRELSDWHTAMGLPLGEDPKYRLNACFIEGDADLSHGLWPGHPLYADILVSHAGQGAAGLKTGDRLVAVDGQHPIAWARSLIEVNPGYHASTDPEVFSDFAEVLGGPSWAGALIIKYARQITVIRCDAAAGSCADHLENIEVASLSGGGGQDVACDNRPFYHFTGDNNPPPSHAVFWDFYDGKIADTSDEEAIYGVVWDTLYGGGDPNGHVNGNLTDLMTEWKANARGVILDHRAGNGGTLDSPSILTRLVRPPETLATVLMPIETAGFNGPEDSAEGLLLFDAFKEKNGYEVGSAEYDPDLPVALITHRDGSASDYLPLGMKGAAKVRLFGPHATAGAFSTFIQTTYYGAFELQFASGDTITSAGEAQIGHGVPPDEVVQQKQSDLLAGRDSLHEAALAWLRANLKPVAP